MTPNLSLSRAALSFVAVVFFTPLVTNATILQTARDFTLLGGTNITASTPVTVISNGNVGLSPESEAFIIGFDGATPNATLVNGVIINTGPVTGLARDHLTQAQTGLAGMPFTQNMTSAPQLGNLTLGPGVYNFDAAADLTGPLILDAQGLTDAFWVFNIGSSLTTAANASVSVINPGSNGICDYGIFWNAGTEIIVGADNVLLGNYLSGTSITLGNKSGGSARALSLAAITLDENDLDPYNINCPLGEGDWTGGLAYVHHDDGSVTVEPVAFTPIPEPSTVIAGCLFVGLAGFVMLRRIRQRKKGAEPI